MSTRKLILTALICGLAIMVAGGTKLFQMTTDEVQAVVFEMGTPRTLSDMTVSVTKVEQTADATKVSVTMVGVKDGNATEGWLLISGREVISPLLSQSNCEPTTVDVVQTCVVGFPASSGSVTVAYRRAGKQSRWAP